MSHVLGRRDALVGAIALTWGCSRTRIVAPTAAHVCALTPEQVEGPYYLNDAQLRSDIREGKPGVPLRLVLTLVDVRSCRPLEGAAVDIWHCDGEGRYSGFVAESNRLRPPGGPPPFGGPPGPGGRGPHDPQWPPPPGFEPADGPPPARRSDVSTFLRGVQLSDPLGLVQFTTVYPGWYPGRAVHIHLRVRTEGTLRGVAYGGGHVAHTGQLYLPESVSDQVFHLPPYASHDGARMLQTEDRIFEDGGSGGLLSLAPDSEAAANAYLAAATVMLDPTSTPAVRR